MFLFLSTGEEKFDFALWGITAEALLRKSPSQCKALMYQLLKRTGDGIAWDVSWECFFSLSVHLLDQSPNRQKQSIIALVARNFK